MSNDNVITIDGQELEFTSGETILDVARRNNIFIPTPCHLPGAAATGACRMCVVEVEKARNYAAACTMPAAMRKPVNEPGPRPKARASS